MKYRWVALSLFVTMAGWQDCAPLLAAGPAAATSAAFIDLNGSAIGSLIEAKLLESSPLAWVDRERLDDLTREQQLAQLFAPNAGSSRIQLGRLVHAEVLVLLRRTKGSDPTQAESSEVVVFETQQGLRLGIHRVPSQKNENPETLAATFVQLIQADIAKRRHPIRSVYAVPPFVSKDLTYRFEYLKNAYAGLIEQLLLDQPGVLVVELDEARSIAREIGLDPENASIQRAVPHFILGEYRHGDGDEATVSIQLDVKHGEKRLQEQALSHLSEMEVPNALRAFCDKLFSNQASPPNAIPWQADEIEELLAREKVFALLGDWPEALNLAEAALLIDPVNEQALAAAVKSSGQIAARFRQFYGEGQILEAQQSLKTHQRGLELMETLLQRYGDNDAYDSRATQSVVNLFPFVLFLGMGPRYTPDALYLETVDKQQSLLLRLVRLRAHQGKHDHYHFLRNAWTPRGLRIDDKQFAEMFKIVGDLILELQDLPHGERRASDLLTTTIARGWRSKPGATELLERLESEGNEGVKLGMKSFLRHLDQSEPWLKKRQWQPAESKPNSEGKIELLSLNWRAADGTKGSLNRLDGCFPISEQWDVLWRHEHLFIMKQSSHMQQVARLPGLNQHFKHVCFDGRYVWAGSRNLHQPPMLVICDPNTEQVWQFSAGEELPFSTNERDDPRVSAYQVLAVAPVAPGHACLIGSFGRTWIANATFDPTSGLDVEIFHEAREVTGGIDRETWSNVALSFVPRDLITFPPDKQGAVDILVGRDRDSSSSGGYGLWIDPLKKSVTAESRRIHALGGNNRFDQVNGLVYFLGGPFNHGFQLHQLGPRGTEIKSVREGIPQGIPLIDGDRLHIFGKRWWTGSLKQGEFAVSAEVPWYFHHQLSEEGKNPDFGIQLQLGQTTLEQIWRSRHFGILAGTNVNGHGPCLFHAQHRADGVDANKAPSDSKPNTDETSLNQLPRR